MSELSIKSQACLFTKYHQIPLLARQLHFIFSWPKSFELRTTLETFSSFTKMSFEKSFCCSSENNFCYNYHSCSDSNIACINVENSFGNLPLILDPRYLASDRTKNREKLVRFFSKLFTLFLNFEIGLNILLTIGFIHQVIFHDFVISLNYLNLTNL